MVVIRHKVARTVNVRLGRLDAESHQGRVYLQLFEAY